MALKGDTYKKVLNLVTFQVGWFACILLSEYTWVALAVTLVAVVLHHLVLVSNSKEWLLVAAFVALGFVVDSAFGAFGVLEFNSGSPFIPIWLACLWVLFALTLCHGLYWLRAYPVVAIAFSAIGAPLSYLAGTKLTSVELNENIWLSLAVIGVFWAVLVPVTLWLAERVVYESQK